MSPSSRNQSTAAPQPSRRTKAPGQGDIHYETNHGTGRAPNNINGMLEPEQAHAEPYPAPHVAEHEAGWSNAIPPTDETMIAPDTEDEIEREENEGGGQHR